MIHHYSGGIILKILNLTLPDLQDRGILSCQSHLPGQNQAPMGGVVCLHWTPVLQSCVKVSHDLKERRR